MSNIVISVSATSDISKEVAQEYGIAVAPMEFSVDGVEQNTLNGVDLGEFYEKMRGGAITRTSQINVEMAREHLEALTKNGNDVLHFAISNHLSGTYDNFVTVASELEAQYGVKIRIVNSLSASCAITLMAVACANKKESVGDIEELFSYAEWLKNNTSALFTVDSLTYLARSGRVSKAAALLGNAIKLKVAMRVDDSGALVPYKKVLSRRRALSEIVMSAKMMYVPEFNEFFVAYADCLDEAQSVKAEIQNELGVKVTLLPLGPVIGSHSGPGTLAIFFTSNGKDIKAIKEK